jgi:AraC-like DNA-binding protein
MSNRVTGAQTLPSPPPDHLPPWSDDVGRLAQALARVALDERPSRAAQEAELAGTILSLLDLSLRGRGQQQRSPPSPAETLRQRVKAYIRLHLRDPDLAIDRIAAALSCSKRYLHMCFADEGLSITEFIWTERLEQCRRDLEKDTPPARTITEVAFSWGFNSSSHFSRLYKKRFGAPPSRTRHCS